MFSIGCLLLELYTGEVLFPTHEDLEQVAMMEIVMGKMPPNILDRARSVLSSPSTLFEPPSRTEDPNAILSSSMILLQSPKAAFVRERRAQVAER